MGMPLMRIGLLCGSVPPTMAECIATKELRLTFHGLSSYGSWMVFIFDAHRLEPQLLLALALQLDPHKQHALGPAGAKEDVVDPKSEARPSLQMRPVNLRLISTMVNLYNYRTEPQSVIGQTREKKRSGW